MEGLLLERYKEKGNRMAEEDTVVNRAERFEGPEIKGEEDLLLGPITLPFGPAPVPPRLANI